MTGTISSILDILFGSTTPVDVTVVVDTPTSARRVYLGKREFTFDANGTGTMSVPPGVYSLFWVVWGGDGQTYSIKVMAPPSAKWEPGDFNIVGDHDVGAREPVVVKAGGST